MKQKLKAVQAGRDRKSEMEETLRQNTGYLKIHEEKNS